MATVIPLSRPDRRPTLGVESLLLIASIGLALFANNVFWQGTIGGRDWASFATWRFAAAVFVAMVGLHFLLLALLSTRHTVRWVLGFAFIASAAGAYYMQRYGIVLDPSMLRNVLRTNPAEAKELLGVGLLTALALGVVAALLPWAVQLRRRPLGRALLVRLGSMLIAVLAVVAGVVLVFQDFGSLMRNQKGLRYTITPANILYSLARVGADDARSATEQRDPPEPAQYAAARTPGQRKPSLLVLVVGETARAANFSLNGYERETNPELAKIAGLVNFPKVEACGTSTEVSLPCMFSPFGLADYDEQRIRRHESLLHLVARAGARVVWLDNQSGCKGVCAGLEERDLAASKDPALCADGRCFDEILLKGLQQVVADGQTRGDLVVVMHQLGNHGPSYFRRYPPAFKRFQPACEKDELRECSREEITAAYDNAILYTDHVLAGTVRWLDGQRERYDVALAYVSDHGESLGERGLYLHGLPRAIAPKEQIEVPMFWWFGAGAVEGYGVDLGCFRERAKAPASHDDLFHSVLGLLGIETARYKPERDLFHACRPSRQAAR